MRIKRVLCSVLLALMLTACGKESSTFDAEIDNSKAEAAAQNLQQVMAEKTSAAAAETTAAVSETLPTEEDILDLDDLPGTWLMVG